jgi:hypothetical protein
MTNAAARRGNTKGKSSPGVSCFLDLLAENKTNDLNHDSIMGCVTSFELSGIQT